MARHHDDDNLPYIVVERRDESSGVLPFLWGAVIGAAAALLLAPRTGSEIRAEITAGARRLRRAAEDTVRGVQDSVTDAVHNVREQVSGRVNVARNAYDAGRSAARESRAEMERRIHDARADFEAGAQAARAGREYTEGDLDEEDV